MADIFISHSSADSKIAGMIGERIVRDRPTWSVFYDVKNIRAGQRWQERLREELQSCRMVLALLSRSWLGSSWCFTEAVTATFRGKDVVGVEIEDLTAADLAFAPPILHERQRIRLRDGEDQPWQEILEALDRSGLDPKDWFPIPPGIGPYPGLVAFGEKDAGVFFGRKQEITEYLGILDTLRGPDRSQLLVISGASGSGKSSLLRAGLIPRLRRKREWVVVSPFELAREPVRNLLDRLREALAHYKLPTEVPDLDALCNDRTAFAQLLDESLRHLELAADGWILLPLDQAEALVAGEGKEGDREGALLLAGLAAVLGPRTRRVVIVATIRTEFVPRLESAFSGPQLRLRHAPLSALGSFSEIIEKPAERFGITLDPGLTGRIINDMRTADALPLLAYTLKELHTLGGADQLLTHDEYRALGGVQGAIAARLKLVLTDPEPTSNEMKGLKRAFTRYLVRVDEGAVEGERLLRRVAIRSSLPKATDRIIDRLINAGLLTTKQGTIELAHERLIDDWEVLPLKSWLTQDATDRRLIDQLRRRVDDDKLPDGLLAQAEELLHRDYELAVDEPALAMLVQRSRNQVRAQERRRRLFLAILVAVAILLAVLVVFAVKQRNEARYQQSKAIENASAAVAAAKQAQDERDKARAQLLAIQARRVDALAKTPEAIGLVGALALESIAIGREAQRPAEADAIELSRSVLIRLPLLIMADDTTVIFNLAVLPDGRLASAGAYVNADDDTPDPGEIKLWPKDGVGEPLVLEHGDRVSSLSVLLDGRLASGGDGGEIKLWAKDGIGEPEVLRQGTGVYSLAALPDGRLASGDGYGNIVLWPKDGVGEPAILKHGSVPVTALAVLNDGRIASANGGYGLIQLWPKVGVGEPQVLEHGDRVDSLAVLRDGRLASAGDGQIKLWPQDGIGEPLVLEHGRGVLSLAVLRDGRLASAGDGQIKLWPKDGVGEPVVLQHGSQGVNALAVLLEGRLVSAGYPQIKLWPGDGAGEPVVLRSGDEVYSLKVLPDGQLASVGHDHIKLWPKSGAGEPVILPKNLAVLPDGRLASADADGLIKVWSRDGAGEPAIFRHGSPVSFLRVLPDGQLASVGSGYHGDIKLWPKSGAGEPVNLRHDWEVTALALLPDGRLASADTDGSIKLWSRDGAGEPVVLQHGSWVRTLIVLPDGRLASAGFDDDGEDDPGTIKLWPKDGVGEPLVLEHGGPVHSLAVLRDGRLGSAGDGQIKLWPKDGVGEPLVLEHSGPIYSLAVLRDGRLASAGGGQIKLWPKDGVGEPVILPQGGSFLAVLPDGRLASANGAYDADGRIKLWLVEEEKLIAALCLRAGRNLTLEEWARYIGPNAPWQPSCRDRPSNWRSP